MQLSRCREAIVLWGLAAGIVSLSGCDRAWTGTRGVEQTYVSTSVDTVTPLSLHFGEAFAVHVQWRALGGSSHLTKLGFFGDDLGTVLSWSGKAFPSGATLLTDSGEIPILPVEAPYSIPMPGGPLMSTIINVGFVAGMGLGNTDYTVGSRAGAVAKLSDDSAVLVGSYSKFITGGTFEPERIFAAKIKPRGSAISYTADEFIGGVAPFGKGKVFSPPGEDFTVEAVAVKPRGGLVFAGVLEEPATSSRLVFVYALNASYDLEAQTTFSVPVDTRVGSVSVASTGDVFICRNSVSTHAGSVTQLSADLTTHATLSLTASDTLALGGCAITPSDVLIATGAFSGTRGRTTSLGSDVFAARIIPGMKGTAPTEVGFVSFANPAEETLVSTPLLAPAGGEASFVAGITNGDFGAVVGTKGHDKIFVIKFNSTTLAQY